MTRTLSELREIAEYKSKLFASEGDEYVASMMYDEAFNTQVALALLGCAEALQSIASKGKLRHENEEYWLKINHAQCATVLATDTKIARGALSKLEAAGVTV